jgi:DNA-binding SARP family transcriptional activator
VDFRILGPLVVRDRGRLIELHRRKPRALLAFLLLRPGETCSSDALIDALWGERPPRTARAALQNYVAQLRRALGPGVLVSQGGGYLLDVSSEQIDLGRFERLTGEGRAAEGEDRVDKLQEALALWRGPPLADLAFEPFAALETPGLEELRTAALEDVIEARLLLGAGPELVPELEQLVADYPFRERLRGQLMLALYRAGRQADALDAYQETRHTLVDELGIEPSAPLRELEQAILRQEAWLDPALEQQLEAPLEERRKTVTILFADIDCPETIDPELLRKATVIALAQVRAVLESHSATIEQRTGDEVLAVFGIPQAHEDDPVRAVRAALELTAAEGLDPEGVELRVGIETGEVLAGVDETGHGFAAGPAITVAKRMLQRAGPGEILLGPAALRVLGAAVMAEPTREGDARVLELAEGVSAPPRQLEAPFVDRGPELDVLRRAFADAVDSRSCRVFLLLGEAGIGKTRLANELASELDGAATVLVGRCVSYGKGATYLPLAEIVRQVGERCALAELLAGDEHAELIAARLADLTGDEEAPGSGGETFWAARRLFESLAGERPLVLVFEDLHWAEPTLLDMIDYFAERVSAAPMLLLGLARPELLDERAEWRNNEAARLVPLSGAESEALMENLGEAPRELRKLIVRAAGGNPLFIEQLLAHANEGGDPNTVPPSLDALLTSRLDRLEPGELYVLQRAAVPGREFSREAVAQLLPDEDAASVDEHLVAAVRKGLIHAGPPEAGRVSAFRFHHVLIRDSAYGTLPMKQRAELHERFARWLEARPTRSDALIGFHLEQAYRYLAELGSADTATRKGLAAEAGERLGTAGLRAAKSGDTHAASSLLTRATSLLEPKEVARRDLLTELGLVYWRAGDLKAVYGALHQALEGALAVGDARAELRARIELAYLKLFREPEGGADELLSATAEAIPVLEQAGDHRTLGVIWAMLAHVHGGFHCRYGESTEAAERAIEHYVRAGWPPSACLQELAVSLYFGPVPVEEGIRRCSALLEHADRAGEGHVLLFRAGLEAMARRFDTARSLASRARATYEELDWADKVWTNYAPIAADVELLAGEHAEAERLLAESCKRLESWGEEARLATQAAQLGEALYRQGKFGEAARWAAVAEGCAASDDASAQFSWRALRAKGLVREGAFGRAQVLAQEAVDIAAPTDAVTQRAHVLLDAAEVASLSGRARAGVEPVEKAARLLDGKGNVASLERARSMLVELTGA